MPAEGKFEVGFADVGFCCGGFKVEEGVEVQVRGEFVCHIESESEEGVVIGTSCITFLSLTSRLTITRKERLKRMFPRTSFNCIKLSRNLARRLQLRCFATTSEKTIPLAFDLHLPPSKSEFSSTQQYPAIILMHGV